MVGIPLIFYSFLMFDRLVKAEYEINRSAWEADGRPRGSFGILQSAHFFGATGQETACLFFGYLALRRGQAILESVRAA